MKKFAEAKELIAHEKDIPILAAALYAKVDYLLTGNSHFFTDKVKAVIKIRTAREFLDGFTKDYGLRDQIRRAAISIPGNIAEGDERETDKQAVRYFYVAKGSSAEVLTQATIAFEIGYIRKETFEEIEKGCIEISSMLSKLISACSRTFRPSPFAFSP